ncbi:hypothetical protein EMB92_10835 [Bifidobacterium callitrichos]|uniref:Uncharacterized protein n=1 Tax=Bifidobacterium callitrichos TaxID=762209 RepID=A0A5M9Z9G4_9BIFI|nr:hypothetical protein [Bifidobacterium callitrichos]KAA8815149.1 hypothetical protein EMB92_10835 [Bifidobacterium callitrichos]
MRVNKPFTPNPLFPSAFISGNTINTTSNMMNMAMLVALLVASIAAIIRYWRAPNSGIVGFLAIVLMGFGMFWMLNLPSGMRLADAINNSGVSSMCFIIAFTMFIGYDEQVWNDVLNAIFVLCAGFTAVALFETVRFVSEYGFSVRLLTSAAVYSITHAMLLMYANLLFNKNSVGNYFVLTFVEIVTLTVLSLILQSRSWSVHGVILLLIFVFKVSNRFKQKLFVRVCIFILIAMLIAVFWNYLALFTSSISNRMNSDSRSGQLMAFFSQVSMRDLLFGQGIDASYFVFGTQYQYLDNLVLLTMFKYGAVPTLIYVILLIVPIVYGLSYKRSMSRPMAPFMLAWLASMLGFSIYVSFAINIYNVVAYILIGRFFALYRS